MSNSIRPHKLRLNLLTIFFFEDEFQRHRRETDTVYFSCVDRLAHTQRLFHIYVCIVFGVVGQRLVTVGEKGVIHADVFQKVTWSSADLLAMPSYSPQHAWVYTAHQMCLTYYFDVPVLILQCHKCRTTEPH